MEKNRVLRTLPKIHVTRSEAPPLAAAAGEVAKPLLPGMIYGEIVFWVMIASMVIAVPGFIMYLRSGGYLPSGVLLDHLWQGSNTSTIWKEVGNASQPLPWYRCLSMLSKGDMLATLGIAVTGVAAIIGMWAAFLGSLRSKMGIFTVFALIIAVILTLSAMGIFSIAA